MTIKFYVNLDTDEIITIETFENLVKQETQRMLVDETCGDLEDFINDNYTPYEVYNSTRKEIFTQYIEYVKEQAREYLLDYYLMNMGAD